ncbi:TraM recognition domain-containing protein [Microbacterium sp. LRZ72]|uniref:type IV secretory system conjugative DNA transfer family protein n=1 Tax=Microbacterium sp. LRZ72 TaxID=2942481 RepID=UPI0029AF5B9F|nr:TraM recognition domain-containing protein [Microbacterium sp. LRZ72]MDX2377609.1 TraM recognition domain-containing protein [Microbacterium sp. LRZ72]
MAKDGFWPKLAAILIAAVILLNLGFAFIAGLCTQLACGTRPTAGSFLAGLWLALSGDPSTFSVPDGCVLPVTAVRAADLALVLILTGLAIWAGIAYSQYHQSDRHFINELRGRPGFARASEISKHLSAKAVLRRAAQLRPGLAKPAPTDVGWRVGTSRGTDVYVSIEDSVALEGPPRSGKGYRVLISAILDWSGPLITTSTTNDNLTATMKMRQRRGTVGIFDPQGLSGIRDTLRISPFERCEDPLVAMQRASAIITGTAIGTSTNNLEWAQASSVVLSRLLHAGAVGSRSIAQLYDWGTSPSLASAAVKVLRTDGAPGWGDSLEALLAGDERLVSSTWFGVQNAVSPLAVPQIRDALSPRPGDPRFDAEAFLTAENTLYLIGSSSGSAAMGGFLGALLDDVVEVARRKALASPHARLGLPLGLILDEIANMFRWGNLPRTMADGGGRGICTFVVLQALSQAETAWSRAEADTIWAAATAKILLGGASQVDHLRDVEALLGNRERRRTQRSWSSTQSGVNTSEQHDRLPLMTVDEIRRMPQSVGLLAYRNRRGVLLDLSGWDERSDARAVTAGKRETEREQQTTFADDFARAATRDTTAGARDRDQP